MAGGLRRRLPSVITVGNRIIAAGTDCRTKRAGQSTAVLTGHSNECRRASLNCFGGSRSGIRCVRESYTDFAVVAIRVFHTSGSSVSICRLTNKLIRNVLARGNRSCLFGSGRINRGEAAGRKNSDCDFGSVAQINGFAVHFCRQGAGQRIFCRRIRFRGKRGDGQTQAHRQCQSNA